MNKNKITVTLPLEEFERLQMANVKNFVGIKLEGGPSFHRVPGLKLIVDVEALENHFEFDSEDTYLEFKKGGKKICRLNIHNVDVAAES